jgi:hypothetical protein
MTVIVRAERGWWRISDGIAVQRQRTIGDALAVAQGVAQAFDTTVRVDGVVAPDGTPAAETPDVPADMAEAIARLDARWEQWRILRLHRRWRIEGGNDVYHWDTLPGVLAMAAADVAVRVPPRPIVHSRWEVVRAYDDRCWHVMADGQFVRRVATRHEGRSMAEKAAEAEQAAAADWRVKWSAVVAGVEGIDWRWEQ